MAAKKTTGEKTGETQVKATTGAWWKSAVTETEAPVAKDTASEEPRTGVEEKPAPAKGRGRKRAAGSAPAEVSEQRQDTGIEEFAAAVKPKRKRAPRKKTEISAVVPDREPSPEEKPVETCTTRSPGGC